MPAAQDCFAEQTPSHTIWEHWQQPVQAAEWCIAGSRPALFQDNYDFEIQGFDNCTAQSPFDSQQLPFDTQNLEVMAG